MNPTKQVLEPRETVSMTKEKIKQLNRVLWTAGRNKQTSLRANGTSGKSVSQGNMTLGQLTPENTLELGRHTKALDQAQAKANNIIYGLSAAQKTIKARQTS